MNRKSCFIRLALYFVLLNTMIAMHEKQGWTFLTNHAHVLLCLHQDQETTMRAVAELVGITERAVHRIVSDLERGGYLERTKVGRRNSYRVLRAPALRHPVEAQATIGHLLKLLSNKKGPG